MELLAYLLAVLIGISLGLIGSGGSILTVPILVYILDINPILATAYSLFIVGMTSLAGGISQTISKQVDYRMVLLFGIPSIIMVLFTRGYIMPHIPEEIGAVGDFVLTKGMFVMVLFAVIMLFASVSMIRSKEKVLVVEKHRYDNKSIILKGVFLGIITGMVGAGGGFLIIPTLVIFAGMPMKRAIGTSLMIIAFNSLIGFVGFVEIDGHEVDWRLLFLFSIAAIMGILIGTLLSRKISGSNLKTSFGWFVLIMGIMILVREILDI
ncbi:sulfite exporter TauE/SafE family protein [Sphingobacterium spiritivorum]|uniref:sulfite exporter TauE/SafE family protein n=1 Tax=Sphingobacterium spiritivorum TaxID=258 RepID=UPI00191A014B|nr:sulfite exporter TauE/SafE family protein [Sphingobacterium spiritivorum]QQT28224.1 sulfite exporter TauE/SafE family protein [Sphingobacterium spiritivorum]